jgi:hypothetical protein
MLIIRSLVILVFFHTYALAVDIHLDIDELKVEAEKDFTKATQLSNVKSGNVILVQMAEVNGNIAVDHSMLSVQMVTNDKLPFGLEWYFSYGLNGKKGLFLGFIDKAGNLNLVHPDVVVTIGQNVSLEARQSLLERILQHELVKSAEVVRTSIQGATSAVQVTEIHIKPKKLSDTSKLFMMVTELDLITDMNFREVVQRRQMVSIDSRTLVNADMLINDRALELRQKLADKVFTSEPHLGAPFFAGTAGVPFFKEYLVLPARSENFDSILLDISQMRGVVMKTAQHGSRVIHIIVKNREADELLRRDTKLDLELVNDRTEEIAGLCKPFQSLF